MKNMSQTLVKNNFLEELLPRDYQVDPDFPCFCIIKTIFGVYNSLSALSLYRTLLDGKTARKIIKGQT